MYSRAAAAVVVLAVTAFLSGGSTDASAHACAFAASDACVHPFAAPAGTKVELEVSGEARLGTHICVTLNDRRAAEALSARTPHMPHDTCPPPLVPSRARTVRVCLQDWSREGREACYVRRPTDPQIALGSLVVREGDRTGATPLSFARTIRFTVPRIRPQLYLVSWFDCPPGDCPHQVFTGFRVLAQAAVAPGARSGEGGNGVDDAWSIALVGGIGLAFIGGTLALWIRRRGRAPVGESSDADHDREP